MALVGIGIGIGPRVSTQLTQEESITCSGKMLCGSSTRRGARLVPSSLEYQCVLPIKGGCWSLEVMV